VATAVSHCDFSSTGFFGVAGALGLVAAAFGFEVVVLGFDVCEAAVKLSSASSRMVAIDLIKTNVKTCRRSENNITKLPFARVRSYPRHMPELDHVWSQMLAAAESEATASGRGDVAEYLRLRAANDSIRAVGVGWLIDTFIEIATSPGSTPVPPLVDREEPHRFERGPAKMVGTRLNIRHGVRCLSIEAGWARTPSDGIMDRRSLAFARISHFGMPRETSELRLVRVGESLAWVADDGNQIDTRDLSQHFELLVS